MMPREDRVTWKSGWCLKIIQFLGDYLKCFTVGADLVGSKQAQPLWVSLRGKAVVLTGRETAMRNVICGHLESVDSYAGMWALCFPGRTLRRSCCWPKGVSCHPCWCHGPMWVRVPAQARGQLLSGFGTTAELSRSTSEILSDVQLLRTGDQVGASGATLLNTWSTLCFFAPITQRGVDTEESVFSLPGGCLPCRPRVCTPSCCISALPVISGYMRVLALSAETDCTSHLLKRSRPSCKDDPSAFMAAAPGAASTAAAPAKAEAKERWEGSDEDTAFGLFD